MMKNLVRSLLCLCLLLPACQPKENGAAADVTAKVTTLILVRHAEKADDGTSDPGLTAAGQVRAGKLAAMLAPAGVDAVFSTPYQRTRATAAPLAEQTKLEIQEYDPKDPDFASRLLADHAGETLLIVGHSNTIPGLVNTLTGTSAFNNLDDMEYDKLFIVHVRAGKGDAVVLSF